MNGEGSRSPRIKPQIPPEKRSKKNKKKSIITVAGHTFHVVRLPVPSLFRYSCKAVFVSTFDDPYLPYFQIDDLKKKLKGAEYVQTRIKRFYC